MKTYILLLKHKIHWLHLAAFVVIIGAFTSVTLQQYASQVFYANSYAITGQAVAVRPPSSVSVRKHTNSNSSYNNRTATNLAQNIPTTNKQSPPVVSTPSATTQVVKPKITNQAAPASPPSSTPTPASSVPPAGGPVNDIATETICPGQSSIANTTLVLVCMTTYARTQHSMGGVSSNGSLMAAATAKVQDMLTCGYSHTACERSFNYWFAVKGYVGRCSAENIAQGQQTPGEVFIAWMNSSGHRANILNAVYQHIGVTVVPSNSGNLWAMELGGC